MSKNYSEKVIKIATEELDYLEKESNKDLDSKTKNAGDKNYTKYARDLIEWIGSPFMQAQPWCVMLLMWCFVKAFGIEGAKKLLHVWTMSCGTLRDAFKQYGGQWVTKDPKVGDLVIFEWYKTEKGKKKLCRHVGIIYKVDKGYIYTIEGNTSCHDKDVIENGGGVFKKSYPKTHPKINGYCRPKYDAKPDVVVPQPTLKRGMKGYDVGMLQQDLNKLGYTDDNGDILVVDNSFGRRTEEAVKHFQKASKIKVDGSYGPETYKKLKEAMEKWTKSRS